MKHLIISGLLVCMAFTGFSQREIEFTEYDLDNGIHVILHQEPSTPIVAVSVLYHVGSKNETPDRTGFAHFFEHLLFEGSENIARGEYSELVEKNGGTLNANTSMDRTFYYEILPSNQLELGIWLESERMLHAKVDNTGIETQRSVVKEEKRQRVDNTPYGTFFENMFKTMFTDHPYRWQPIGSMEHLDAAQEEDYVNFYRTFYIPANATLSIAGDIDIEETKAWVDKYFGSVPTGQALNVYRDYVTMEDAAFEKKYEVAKTAFPENNFMNPKDSKAKALLKKYAAMEIEVPRPEKVKTQLSEIRTKTVYDNIQLPGLFIGYQLPDQTHEDMYALQMMNDVLSGGASSRINKSVVEKQQLAQAAFAFSYGLEDAGIGLMAAIASKDVELDDIQKAFDVEIEKVQSELISEEEFQKIRNQYENDFISSNASVAGIAENLANNHVYMGDANLINNELDKYLQVTREDIQRVAKKYLTSDARVIMHYLPKEEENTDK